MCEILIHTISVKQLSSFTREKEIPRVLFKLPVGPLSQRAMEESYWLQKPKTTKLIEERLCAGNVSSHLIPCFIYVHALLSFNCIFPAASKSNPTFSPLTAALFCSWSSYRLRYCHT